MFPGQRANTSSSSGLRRDGFCSTRAPRKAERLTYTSTAAFLDNNMGSASYTAILPLVRQRKTQYFGYVQDEWKATAESDHHGRNPL